MMCSEPCLGYSELLAQARQLHQALAFAAAVIASGESWSKQCEDIIGGALGRKP